MDSNQGGMAILRHPSYSALPWYMRWYRAIKHSVSVAYDICTTYIKSWAKQHTIRWMCSALGVAIGGFFGYIIATIVGESISGLVDNIGNWLRNDEYAIAQ